jgi:hypothetical protein
VPQCVAGEGVWEGRRAEGGGRRDGGHGDAGTRVGSGGPEDALLLADS